MPFGHRGEFPNFEACVAAMAGKVDDPKAYCATLMRETEGKRVQASALAKAAGRGLMVAFLLPEEAAKALAVPGGEPPEDLHLTLCYLGALEDLEPGTVEGVLAAVQGYTARRPPLTGQVSGIGRFDASTTSDGDEVIYASFDSPELAAFREDLVLELGAAGTYPRKDHGFTPHITLAYVKPGEKGPEKVLPLKIRLDQVLVASGDVREFFKLRGPEQLAKRKPALAVRLAKAAAEDWARHWHEAMPRLGRPRAYIMQVKEIRKGKDWEPESVHLRFQGAGGRSWGFGLEGWALPAIEDEPIPAWPKAIDAPEIRDAEGPRARWIRKWTGLYRLGHATEDLVEVFLDESQRLVLERKGDDWQATTSRDAAHWSTRQDLAKSLELLRARGVAKAVLPRDPLNLARGHRLVDVTRETARLASYRLLKRSDEQRFTLGVAYPADEVDAHGDYATADELEKAAWKFMERPAVGLMHRYGTEGAGKVVESYIYRGPVWKIGDQEVKAGDWLMGVVWKEEPWQLIKRGEINGFSIQGTAAKG